MSTASFLRSTRLIHLYFGVFIAPALLFFAFTGALQTFSLHETTRGSNYVPPRWAVILGQIHKKQTDLVPVRRAPQLEGRPAGPSKAESGVTQGAPAPAQPPLAQPKRHPMPLKIFFLVVAVGLFTSTLTGIYMAYKFNRRPALITSLLVAGAVIPVGLVFV